jgi:DDE family transposase
MAWDEAQGVNYILGLAKNSRLLAQVPAALAQAQAQFAQTGQPARVFTEFRYCTRDRWTQERRVVAKAEHLEKGSHPRFVVTSLPSTPWTVQTVHEQLYCARGDMGNRIKEQQLDLFADRATTAKLGSNQIRLYFSSFAYLLLQALRRLGLHGTEMAHAQCGTIRLRLLKIGALLTVNARRIGGALASGYPYVAYSGDSCHSVQRKAATQSGGSRFMATFGDIPLWHTLASRGFPLYIHHTHV